LRFFHGISPIHYPLNSTRAQNKKSIELLYQKRAKRYDVSANIYYFLGIREFAYRKIAVQAINLKQGDTVVEIGCAAYVTH